VFPPKPDRRTLNGLGRIVATDAHLADLAGQPVYFSLSLRRDDPPPLRSSRLNVTGMLQTLPRDPADPSFDGYLANQGINFKLTRARVTGEVAEAGAYRIFCDTMLRRLNAILGQGVGAFPAQTGVLRAMLLGQQQELTGDQKAVFRESGTMHLFSISGLHIAVIAGALHGILLVLRLPATGRLVAGGVLLWLYVDITGGTPSAVRAFLMVMFVHASHVLRLPGNPLSALAASAVCVLLLQPMQLFSASFQLSYGIVAALLLLGLPLGEYWVEKGALFNRLPSVAWGGWRRAIDGSRRGLLGMVAIGLATTTVSTVSGVLIFQLFTPVALLANLVLIPAGSLVIISGFLAILAGLAGIGWLVNVLNHASVLLLMGIEKAVHVFVTLPGAHHAAVFSPAWLGFPAFAGLLAVILHGYAHHWELRRGGYWAPFAYTVLVLLLAVSFPVMP
ncbi:MAG TPA: ComEC/Rec2 family competence protein, partial [Rariglobus sp.]